MKINLRFWNLLVIFALAASGLSLPQQSAAADSTAQPLPFSQDWSNTGLITVSDDWSGVPGIMGYRGDGLTDATDTNPQTILNEGLVIDVNANQTTPNTYTTGGVTEFHITDPVVALAGSGTADAPYVLITIDTTDFETIQVAYNIRDLEDGTDNAVQQVALHYRVGTSGNFTNIPEGYIADATVGSATMTTPISVTLPAAADNQPVVQFRVMTTNATDSDEWVGIDDISVTGTLIGDPAPTVVSTDPANEATGVALASDITVTFSEAVTAAPGAFALNCAGSGDHTLVANTTDNIVFTLNPDADFSEGELCTVTVVAANVTDVDTADPADNMAADYVFTFTTFQTDPLPTVESTVPLSAATGVAVADDLSVTFSEAVTLAEGAVDLTCTYSGAHTVVVSSTDQMTHTINPDVDLTPSESCTATLDHTLITDAGAQNLAEDYTWSFSTYYDPAAVTPIAVARAAGVGWTGTIEGHVTLTAGVLASNSFAIQDGTGGIYIYPAYGYTVPDMALGDVVRVTGTIVLFNGLLEVSSITNVTWVSTGAVPDPLVTPTGSIAPTQGELIQVEGTVRFPSTPPAPGTNYTFYIDDGTTGEGKVYVYKLTGIDLRGFTNGQRMRIIGLSNAYNGAQLQPRYQSDIIDLRSPTVTATLPAADATGVSPHRPLSATFDKAMDPATLNGTTFTLTSSSGPVTGTISYVASTRTATFTPDAALAPLTVYTATLTTGVTDSYGVALAADHAWSFTTGELDTIDPTIVSRSPADQAVDVAVSAPVVVTFSEELAASSLDTAHFVLTGPYGVVPAAISYDAGTFAVTLTPDAGLLYSTPYTMTVTANTADYAGNPLGADDVWTFTTMAEPPMQTYFGDLHNHTSYSDGSGTPTQALAAGEAAGFDFMAISDHSYAISDTEWLDTLSAVEAATDANFVALRGFEYTQGAEGHINVWNSERHATRTNVARCTYCDYAPNLEAGTTVTGFYPWLVSEANTPLDAAGEVMQFNHPGWINFNDWTYHPEVSDVARLEEVGNGNGSSYAFSEDQYIRSLDYGWKLGATSNADTHTDEWGTNTDARTGVVMPELTKTALLEALRLRRTFATEDKNSSLTMKANGTWMGSEIANTGQIQFAITGADADGELASLVELITDQGALVQSYTPTTSSFTWEPQITITTGVHYYYVKVTQADGDRIVSSPVWTMGSEDIAITDITIQPTIPTIYSSSLLTVRVTNRVAESRTVSVVLNIGGNPLGSPVEVTVPANGDNYAIFSWQPGATGSVEVEAALQNPPTGDNPDDNSATLQLDVTDEQLPLILIDAGHGNVNATGNEMQPFINDLSDHHYNVLKNLDELTAADLNPAVVKLLMITAPETAYTADELTAIANYVDAGGSLWIGGLADYNKSLTWANTVANRENAILDAIEGATGQQINMRMNDDEVIDGDTNNGYIFGVRFQSFPGADATGIGVNVESVSTWSLSSIRGRNVTDPLTEDTPGVQIVMQGDLDPGCTSYPDPFHTSNTDYDKEGDAYIYNPSFTCGLTEPPADAIPLPAAAVTQLTGGAGRIMLYGDSNDPFTMFAYTAGDGQQNELFNLQSIMWLLGEPLEKSTIAAARAQTVEDQPDMLDSLVWVEGEITAAYGEFFNVLYVEDETGGITVHAPAGDIDSTAYTRGTRVRVIGTIGIYNGDTEIEFFEAEMVQVLETSTGEPAPTAFTTAQATLESNEGWLGVVTGRVTQKSGTDTLYVDDGSGAVRVFLDGYNGTFADIAVGDFVSATGLLSEDGDGARIRVRNYKAHPEYADDVIVITNTLYLPIVSK